VPAVVVSKPLPSAMMTEAVKLGAVHYLLKPFTAQQVGDAAQRVLQLKPSVIEPPTPRVLVQPCDDALVADLRARLPSHVVLEAPDTFARLMDMAEKRSPALVLLDGRVGAEELLVVAGVVRKLAPVAGIFGVVSEADPSKWWSPQRALDGVISRRLDEALVHDFLYLNFLRQLVFESGQDKRAAGFQGDPLHVPAYFQAIGRHLIARAEKIALMEDVRFDLTSVPADAERLVDLIVRVTSGLRESGAAAAVRLTEPMRAAVAKNPRLIRVPLV
jgi:hypothetical protein